MTGLILTGLDFLPYLSFRVGEISDEFSGSILEMNLQFHIWTQKQREKEQKLHAIKVLQELSAGPTDYFSLSTPLKPSPWGLACLHL